MGAVHKKFTFLRLYLYIDNLRKKRKYTLLSVYDEVVRLAQLGEESFCIDYPCFGLYNEDTDKESPAPNQFKK